MHMLFKVMLEASLYLWHYIIGFQDRSREGGVSPASFCDRNSQFLHAENKNNCHDNPKYWDRLV